MKLNTKSEYDMHRFRTFFKVKTIRDKKRLAFARSLPCCGCGKLGPNESHHEGSHGMGIKAGDDKTLPLCRRCHAWRHQTGPSIYELWNVDVESLLERINGAFLLANKSSKT